MGGERVQPKVRVFRYLPEVDAFTVTPEYRELADQLGIAEWNHVVWIGRLFALDNDFGEHWFDNWEAREARAERAGQLGLDADALLVLDPERFVDRSDGPCHPAAIRRQFWFDVLVGLELSYELLFAKAREWNEKPFVEPIPDLEARIERCRRVAGGSA